MNTNEFDDLIKAKVEQAELAYNPANWEKLTRELKPAPVMHISKPNYMRYMGIAASLLLVVSAFGWFLTRDAKDETIAKTPAANITAPATVNHQKKAHLPPVTEEETTTQNNTPVTPATNAVIPAIAHKQRTTTQTAPQASTPIVEDKTPVPVQETQKPIVQEQPAVAENKPIQKPAPANPFAFNDQFPPQRQAAPAGKTHVSITGGMNYGSLNTGYVAGINARQKVGGKLYVEGDLGIVSNQVNQSTVTSAQYNTFGAGLAGKSSVSNVVTQTPSNFLYVQFNPSLGYQVHKKVSLSLGADLQRLLDQNDNLKTLVYTSDEMKLIPGLDVGLTGKTEYAVTKKLKAGVLYREGINNLVNGGGDEYLDRRYLQVQLKFTVFGK